MSSEQKTKLYSGTSGYHYPYWGNDGNKEVFSFYKTKSADSQFKEYVKHFSSVELCCTAYRAVTPSMCQGWYRKAPEGFIYTVKIPQYITNMKKLNDFQEWWDKFEIAISELKEKLGVLLFLFNEYFHQTSENLAKLEIVKKTVPEKYRCAVEFRHDSWFYGDGKSERKVWEEKRMESLFQGNWTMAITHTSSDPEYLPRFSGGLHYGNFQKSNFRYIRLHGTSRFCSGTYGFEKMREIMEIFADPNIDTYLYCNNTDTWEIAADLLSSSLGRNEPSSSLIGMTFHQRPLGIPFLPSPVFDAKIARQVWETLY
jgi:uncharacterized protein YecE (DUF72 family)